MYETRAPVSVGVTVAATLVPLMDNFTLDAATLVSRFWITASTFGTTVSATELLAGVRAVTAARWVPASATGTSAR